MRHQMFLTIAAVTFALALTRPTAAADHIDGPSTTNDPPTDITDLYVFPSPEHPDRLVLVMDIFPNAGASAWFSDALEYRFRMRPVSISGTGADASFKVADQEIVFSCTFTNLIEDGDLKTQHGSCKTTPQGELEVTVNQIVTERDYSVSGVRVFAGLRLDPFFIDAKGIVVSKHTGKLSFTGVNSLNGLNCLSIIFEFDTAKFLPNPKGMYGVVAEIRTQGKKPILLDTFGRPEVTNVILNNATFDKSNKAIDVRDLYNRQDLFGEPGAYAEAIRSRFNANLHRLDSLDGNIDWPMTDDVHPLTNLHMLDFTVIDLAKPVGTGSWFEIERAIVIGDHQHETGGGRWLNDDISDLQYTFLIARGRENIGDDVDQATKPATNRFPYLQEPLK